MNKISNRVNTSAMLYFAIIIVVKWLSGCPVSFEIEVNYHMLSVKDRHE